MFYRKIHYKKILKAVPMWRPWTHFSSLPFKLTMDLLELTDLILILD